MQLDLQELCFDKERSAALLAKLHSAVEPSGLNVLVNNAAVQPLNSTEKITLDEWRQTLDINLTAPFLLIQGLLPALERVGGNVVNISSVHAIATKPAFVTYATSKAALGGLTRALAIDLGGRVRVNAINPAATATAMLLAGFVGKEAQFEELSRMHPVGRIAQPEEVASAALFLASTQADFITGASLNLDGGISVRLHDPG